MTQPSALVLGAGGFVGGHLVKRLKREGYWVRGVSRRPGPFMDRADSAILGDLRDDYFVNTILDRRFDEIYQLAADMGGAGYTFSGDNDADIMRNSAQINLNVAEGVRRQAFRPCVFFASSACVYPSNVACATEAEAYPANPESEYGWEKLFAERLWLAHARNHGFEVRIARFHTLFGPECVWDGGREKAIAAICRKVAMAEDGGTIAIWGDGEQSRSFLYIDEALEGVARLMRSTFQGPVNIGSNYLISINLLVEKIAAIAGKKLNVAHLAGPTGPRVRNSNNALIHNRLGWAPATPLAVSYSHPPAGLRATYEWIAGEVAASRLRDAVTSSSRPARA
jgi:nucleoside-diphosphate-sugar epimerase